MQRFMPVKLHGQSAEPQETRAQRESNRMQRVEQATSGQKPSENTVQIALQSTVYCVKGPYSSQQLRRPCRGSGQCCEYCANTATRSAGSPPARMGLNELETSGNLSEHALVSSDCVSCSAFNYLNQCFAKCMGCFAGWFRFSGLKRRRKRRRKEQEDWSSP